MEGGNTEVLLRSSSHIKEPPSQSLHFIPALFNFQYHEAHSKGIFALPRCYQSEVKELKAFFIDNASIHGR